MGRPSGYTCGQQRTLEWCVHADHSHAPQRQLVAPIPSKSPPPAPTPQEPSNSHCYFNEFATYLVLSGKTRLQSSTLPARTQVYFLHWPNACLRFGFLIWKPVDGLGVEEQFSTSWSSGKPNSDDLVLRVWLPSNQFNIQWSQSLAPHLPVPTTEMDPDNM